ncbi:MAG: diflavin oxidoreductase [Alphaproteobacteria bacterium]
MLNPDQKKLLDSLLGSVSRDQTLWLSGYLQGLAGADASVGGAVATQVDKPKVNVYYATETGNSKALSLNVMKALKGAGFKTKASVVNRLKPEDFKKDEFAIFLVSTHGEGTPPETAEKFFELMGDAPEGLLENLSYAALGLGDSSYEIFCGAIVTLDKELSRMGAKAFQDIKLLDVDYASHTAKWIEETVANLNKLSGDTGAVQSSASFDNSAQEVRTGLGYTRLEPIKGKVTDIVNLNDRGSKKETYHIEISYEDDVVYTPGDAVGIILPDDVAVDDVTPRLYSIASSPSFHEGEIHLTVSLTSYTKEDGSTGHGLASGFLSQVKEDDEIEFYISQNQLFNLPADDQDAIMIGPGTGIAPFRSFVYERSERGASGRNWLVFGDQHAHCDFLYQAEWQEHLAVDALDRLDLAFSRDQDHKVYVQNRLEENADEVINWLDGGAVIYVCGAKDPMSKDVDQTLIKIISEKKSLSTESAEDYLADLEEQGRYLKDVY